MKRQIEIGDLADYFFPSHVCASPDGRRVAFAVSRAGESGYTSHIWVMDAQAGGPRPVTGNGDERVFVWLDGDTLLFPSKRGKDKDGETTFYRLDLRGGEAERAFSVALEVEEFWPLTGGKWFLTGRRPCEAVEERSDRAKLGKDYWAFDELPFWSDGAGKVSRTRRSGFLFDPATGELKQLTEKYFELEGAEVSKAGDQILCWGAAYTDLRPEADTLCLYDGEGQSVRTVETGLAVSLACWWGEDVLLEGVAPANCAKKNPDLYLLKPDGALERFLSPDGPLGGTPVSDMAYGGGKLCRTAGDGCYATQIRGGETAVLRLTKDGGMTELGRFDGVNALDLCGGTLFCAALQNGRPPEIYTLTPGGAKTQRTDFHGGFLERHEISVPEHFTYQNRDGCELEGWAIRPVGASGGKAPGVLTIHGGPHMAYGGLYCHEFQCLAAQGYYVFYTNPHGSGGRGEQFADIAGDWGGKDYADLMDFTDEVLRRYPDLDGGKLGVSGGSYGGYMVNWIIGHTDRFQAACAQRCVSNFYTAYLASDLGYRFYPYELDGASPWAHDEMLWDRSPLKYVGNAVTPTLFLHSDEDYRAWLSEPLQMFTNLRQRNIPAKVVLFHGESHDLSRSGAPKNRKTRLRELCGWFKTYLHQD